MEVFFLFCDQMSKPPMWIAPLFGGVALSAMSVATNYYVDRQAPKTKTIARDFILGAILVLCIMQILPESVSSGVAMLMTFSSAAATSAATATTISAIADLPISEPIPLSFVSDDVEVRVGVPKF
jgi:zinc transporter ZupT